ncbi:threonylcarbamoyl-AMP synthase [Alistipes sp. OttesenSCG-928-B03]|nr:threonylcarbamoyl-AMP synthase [Alistipes sp. OttesenSCG-928-B03]
MVIKIYPQNPNEKSIAQVVDVLRNDGVIIYPTDGVYAYGCSVQSPKAIERIKTIKRKKEGTFSIMCADLSGIADYAKVDTPTFKLLKRNLPGPFTFILKASSKVPDKVLARRKTIGVRIADNPVTLAIVSELGSPMITSSVRSYDEILEYATDPELIAEQWGGDVDAVVDGGYGNNVPTTLVDLSDGEIEILREGGGELLE